jgi:DNA-binding HxlR family transcriptional regulator
VKPRRRSYDQHCGLARALDIVGERWTLLVVRDLLLGPRRYGDLLASLDGITTNLLAKRLRELVAAGLVEKRQLGPPHSGEVYALAERGRALEAAVGELGRWGMPLLDSPRRTDRRDFGWALLSLKRRYPGRGSGRVAEVVAGDRRFEVTLGAERLGVEERPAPLAAVTIHAADPASLFAVFMGGVSPAALERRGALVVSGDRAVWSELVTALAPPAKNASARRAAAAKSGP